jgi:predicted  nucleic acid-binding Zn-ribbon protein
MKDYEEMQGKANGLEGTCKELITRLESKESEVSNLETRVMEYSRRNEEIESQNRSLVQKLKQSSAIADQAMTLNDEMETLRAKLTDAQSKEQSQNRLVSSLEERLSVYQSQYEDSHSKSASENETLLKQVEKMSAELTQKNAKITRLEALQSTTDELQSQSNELLETITSLKEENHLLQRQIDVKDTVIAQQKARALSLVAAQSAASSLPLDAVVTSPSRKANLGSLLQTTSTPTHSRNPSTGSTSNASTAQTPTPPPNNDSNNEAQLLLKQQQDQLSTMQAQLEAREKDMAAQQRQLMETLTKINLNIVATRPKPPGTCVILLGNLPEEVIYDPDIIQSMEDLIGGSEIKSFRWVSKDGEFLGFGFLELLTTKDADKAVSRNGKVYLNRQISIAFATREEFEAGKPSRG